MLFCVVTRGVERMRPLPVVSSADSARSRLNAPLTDPSARPTALVAPPTPRFTALFVAPPGCAAPVLPPRALGEQRLELLRLCVAQGFREHLQLPGERLLVVQLAALAFLVGEHRERRDADDRAVHDVPELVGAQNHVERLIPWHVAQL